MGTVASVVCCCSSTSSSSGVTPLRTSDAAVTAAAQSDTAAAVSVPSPIGSGSQFGRPIGATTALSPAATPAGSQHAVNHIIAQVGGIKLNPTKMQNTINPAVVVGSSTSLPRGRAMQQGVNPLVAASQRNDGGAEGVSFLFEEDEMYPAAGSGEAAGASRERASSIGVGVGGGGGSPAAGGATTAHRSATRLSDWGGYSINSAAGNRSIAQSQLTDRGVAFGSNSMSGIDPRMVAGVGAMFSGFGFASGGPSDAFSDRRQRSSGSGSVSVEEQSPSKPAEAAGVTAADAQQKQQPPSHNNSTMHSNAAEALLLSMQHHAKISSHHVSAHGHDGAAGGGVNSSQSLDGFMETRSHPTNSNAGDMVSTMTMHRSHRSLLTNQDLGVPPLLCVPMFAGGGPLGSSDRERSTSGFVDMTMCSGSLDSGVVGMHQAIVVSATPSTSVGQGEGDDLYGSGKSTERGTGVGGGEGDEAAAAAESGEEDMSPEAAAIAAVMGGAERRVANDESPSKGGGVRRRQLRLPTFSSKASSSSNAAWPQPPAPTVPQ